MTSDELTRFERLLTPEPNTGCWLWMGTGARIPIFYKRGSEKTYAYRTSYEHFVGAIGDGMCVCHRCDTPSCVNPAHLFLGTHADNMADRNRKGRQARGERVGLAKLTTAQASEILRRRRGGEAVAVLAAEFGLSKRGIYAIAKGQSYVGCGA